MDNLEKIQNTQEQRKPAKEGGLKQNIEKMRKDIASLTSMIDQIELLQKVPHGYGNIAGEGKVDSSQLPALDQFIEYRGTYDNKAEKSEEAIRTAYNALLDQVSMLRDMTGINTAEEAMRFDKNTGRQEKDK